MSECEVLVQLRLLDSISAISNTESACCVITGSHGGVTAANFVLACDQRAHVVAFNDAGVGKQDAGVVALALLAEHNIAAMAYSHDSACIGDAEDAWKHGVLTRVNHVASAYGARTGMSIQEACALWVA